VVVATAGDLPAVATALAEAFFDDPVMSWILREEESRERRLARLFGVQLRGHYLPLATVWTTPDHAGAALWAPPGHAIIAPTTILRYLPDMVRALGRHALRDPPLGAGQGYRVVAARPGPRPVRPRRDRRLSRILQVRQHRLLPASRLRGDGRDRIALRRPPGLAHVEGSPAALTTPTP
jgi:hypothetical protein